MLSGVFKETIAKANLSAEMQIRASNYSHLKGLARWSSVPE